MAKVKATLLYNAGWMTEEDVLRSGAMKESDRAKQRVELTVRFHVSHKRGEHWTQQYCPVWTRTAAKYIPTKKYVQEAANHIAEHAESPEDAKKCLENYIKQARTVTNKDPASVWPAMVLGEQY